MGCANCGSEGGCSPAGCRNNGSCGTGGCDKLEVYDWLSNIELPSGQKPFDCIEVRFKNSRKQYFKNAEGIKINAGDVVVVEASPGHDVGVVSITGELARIQMSVKRVSFDSQEVKKVYRKAHEKDVEKWQEARQKEMDTMHQARVAASGLGLQMKICDVEYQGDGTKATFYYTAEDRVDFRELIKVLADKFKVRIEMRQIGARQEAGRLGGIGACGRELCCSTWLTDFRSVSTSAARYQQLSLNPQKLAGQCGKLKCCLNYELDQYVDTIKDFPNNNIKLETKLARAYHIKTDIFNRLMYYVYELENNNTPIALSVDRVKEIVEMNKAGQKPEDLRDFAIVKEVEKEVEYENVVGQDSLTRFDERVKKKKKKKRKPKKGNSPQGQHSQQKDKQGSQNRDRNKNKRPNKNNQKKKND